LVGASLGRRIAVILAVSAVGAAWLIATGPVLVIRITTPIAEYAPFWYMFLAFPLLGMLVADIRDAWRPAGPHRAWLWLAVRIGLVVGISNLRLGVFLPISGHALLAAFLVTLRLRERPWDPGHRSPRRAMEATVAAGILLVIAYVKLAWWTDPITLGCGVVLGAGLALAGPARSDAPARAAGEPVASRLARVPRRQNRSG
jgi:hypothetical protein